MSKAIREKSRINIYLPADLKDWAWEQAEKNGFSLTMMVQVMMLDYKKQQEAMDISKIAQLLIDLQKEKEYEENNPK